MRLCLEIPSVLAGAGYYNKILHAGGREAETYFLMVIKAGNPRLSAVMVERARFSEVSLLSLQKASSPSAHSTSPPRDCLSLSPIFTLLDSGLPYEPIPLWWPT